MSFAKRSSLGTRKSVPASSGVKSKRKRGNTDIMSMKSMPVGSSGGGDGYSKVIVIAIVVVRVRTTLSVTLDVSRRRH